MAGPPASEANAAGEDGSPPGLVGLGPALRQAWIGYQLRLDAAMAAAGFEERRFPAGRVLRLCRRLNGSTISAIGRELDISRQGAGKLIQRLSDRGYVSVADSASSKREKSVVLTRRGIEYLEAEQKAARSIESGLRTDLGDEAFGGLLSLIDALSTEEQPRLRAYLRRSATS